MNVLITGISGYVGSRLAPRLLQAGHEVRGFSRRDPRMAAVRWTAGDAVSGAGLAQALDGVEVAYFLIHSMEASRDGSFVERDRAAARNFATAAKKAGVSRVIYLGGLLPAAGAASAHLSSREAVELVLRATVPDTIALRASIVIGAGSSSFRFLVRLIERMPVIPLPGWRNYRTSPIDERDVIEVLARAATSEELHGETLDLGGREIVTYGELIDRIRDLMLVDRAMLPLGPFTVTPIASRVAAVIAGERHELVGPLMESLTGDLLPRDDRAAQLLRVRLHSLDAAIEHALREWEESEPLSAR